MRGLTYHLWSKIIPSVVPLYTHYKEYTNQDLKLQEFPTGPFHQGVNK